jgi:hypothetical protein
MNRLVQSTCLIAMLSTACPLGYSQDSGVIGGRVTDPTGAVVPGAAVTVTQIEMNFESVTATNNEGLYRVLSLRPGPYRVTVTAPGFEHLIRDGLSLRQGETMNIDLALKLGAATESVEVTGAATLLQTETSSTGVVLNGGYVNNLPIYQRRELSILYFTPGVSMPYTSNGVLASLTAFHINGLPTGALGYYEDGVLTTQPTIMGAVEEIQVVSTVPPAEYGHAAGGFVTAVKKYGSNQFHGTLSELGRTRIMTERKYFDKYRNSQIYPGHPTPDGYYQQYPEAGVTGPVYIPKVYNGKNKTFFMFTLQRQMESQFHQTPFTAPDANMLAGNFSFGGLGQPIYDPRTTVHNANGTWSRSPFPGNIIPVSQWSPVAQKLLSFNPFRTADDSLGSIGTTGPANNVFYSQDAKQNIPQYAARLDQQFTSNVKTFLSWTRYKTDAEPTKSGTVSYLPFDSGSNRTTSWMDTWASSTTWIISPTMVSETRFGYVRSVSQTVDPTYGANIASLLGIPGLPPDTFPVGLYTGIGQAGPASTVTDNFSLRQDISKAKGPHAIKFGYELLRFRQDAWTVGAPSGTFTLDNDVGLNSNGIATPNTGNAFAGFLTGAVDAATFTKRLQASLPRQWQNSAYIQDDWKVTPIITINIGVRYSVEPAPTQKWGYSSLWEPNAVDPSSNNYVGFTCPAGGCMGAYVHAKGLKPYATDWGRVDPRFGIAWHVRPAWVLRGGFGVTTVDNRFLGVDTDEEVINTATQAQPAGNPAPLYYLSDGPGTIAYPAVRPDGSVPYAGVPGGHTATWIDPHLKNPYTMTWNVNIQHELSKNYVLTGIYSGSGSVDLTGTMQVNVIPYGYDLNNPAALAAWIPTAQYSRPWPNWGNIGYIGNFGHGTHHEATLSLEKRLSAGLNFTAYYTFQKSIDGNATTEYICTCLNKARSAWDQRHTLSATSTYELPVGQGRRFLNKRGWKDYLLGGYRLTLNYSIRSGGPLSVGLTGAPTLQYPAFVANYGNVMLFHDPGLRADWKNLGGDRFNQANENSLLNCAPTAAGAVLADNSSSPCFTYIPSYGMGTDGRDITNSQRIIAFAFSATKEIRIKENVRWQIRYDFQNPLKWYTLNAPTTILALGSPTLYGKTSLDAGTANLGGQPLMNLGFALIW